MYFLDNSCRLQFGVYASSYPQKNKEALLKFLAGVSVEAFDEAATDVYGRIRAELKKNGNLIGPLDMLIAAHSISLGIILVTNNTKEFERITDIKLENWASE